MPWITRRDFLSSAAAGITFCSFSGQVSSKPGPAGACIGCTEYETNRPAGRHANQVTSQAVIIRADGSGRRVLMPEFGERPFSWTQFAGWSPDGQLAVVATGWEDPKNAAWEEEHKTFRMTEGWRMDVGLFDLKTGTFENLSAVDRVSEYNGGLQFWPGDPSRLAFTPLINGVSHPFVMDRDGGNKKDLSDGAEGFTYGLSASPDGSRIAYHKDYQIYVANADGSNAVKIDTGNPFNFVPRWSPDGQWLMFVSGEHYDCHPHVVKSDGSELRKIADRRGHTGVMTVYDVFDFHGGSSDVPAWSIDGRWIYFTSKIEGRVELMRVSLEGTEEQLTYSQRPESMNYHPTPTPDGKWILFGSTSSGRRQIHRIPADGGKSVRVTNVPPGWGVMWPHPQPTPD